MLQPFPTITDPYPLNTCVGFKETNMPVWPGRGVQMVVHSGADAAGAEGAADVQVEATLEAHVAEPPDEDFGIAR